MWLGWTPKQWADFGNEWYSQVDRSLDIEKYLESYFCASVRVKAAEQELKEVQDKQAALVHQADQGLSLIHI